MQKHKTHSTDERAKSIFKAALPPEHWQVYDIYPDYAKDFFVELVESGEQSGANFFVQLKGSRLIRPKGDGFVRFRLETDHAGYFMSLREPVFLVVVDVTTNKGYWLFIQRYVSELEASALKTHATITVRLPAANLLTNLDRLRKEVYDARSFMAETHATAVEAAVRADVRRMESLDRRFRIELRATSDSKLYVVHSKEPVEGTFTFKGDPLVVQQKVEDLFGRGKPVQFTPDEVESTGSPLIEHLLTSIRCIQAAWTLEGSVTFTAIKASGQEVGTLEAIPCKFEGGRSEFSAEAVFPHELGTFSQSCDLHGKPVGPFRLRLDFNKWKGHRISSLPLFGPLSSVFNGRQAGDCVRLTFYKPGERLFELSFTVRDETFAPLREWLETLRQAREVGNRLGMDPVLPHDFNDEDIHDIEVLYDIVVKGRRAENGANFVVNSTSERNEAQRFVSNANAPWTGARFQGEVKMSADFLREKRILDAVEFSLTEADAEASRSKVIELLKDSNVQLFEVEWRGTAASVVTYTLMRLDPDPTIHTLPSE